MKNLGYVRYASLELAKRDCHFDWLDERNDTNTNQPTHNSPLAIIWQRSEAGGYSGIPGSLEVLEEDAQVLAGAFEFKQRLEETNLRLEKLRELFQLADLGRRYPQLLGGFLAEIEAELALNQLALRRDRIIHSVQNPGDCIS